MKKKSLIEYAVTFAVFCAGQLFLLIAGTPFCVAAATVITVGTLLTLLITKRYIPAAVFAVMCLALDLPIAAPGLHFSFYLIVCVSAALMFGAVIFANKVGLGLLFSDLFGLAAGYFPVYLFVKYAMPGLTDAVTFARIGPLCELPLISGFLIAGVITFFAVPAANVITRDGF